MTSGPIPTGDVRAQRIIPPSIMTLLRDRRVEPAVAAYIISIAGKPREDWTVADFQMVTSVVPAITEMHIGTARLSEFYDFMGLDPTSLFEPQLGFGWQTSSTAFDPRSRGRRPARCATLSARVRVEPEAVRLQDLLNCADPD